VHLELFFRPFFVSSGCFHQKLSKIVAPSDVQETVGCSEGVGHQGMESETTHPPFAPRSQAPAQPSQAPEQAALRPDLRAAGVLLASGPPHYPTSSTFAAHSVEDASQRRSDPLPKEGDPGKRPLSPDMLPAAGNPHPEGQSAAPQIPEPPPAKRSKLGDDGPDPRGDNRNCSDHAAAMSHPCPVDALGGDQVEDSIGWQRSDRKGGARGQSKGERHFRRVPFQKGRPENQLGAWPTPGYQPQCGAATEGFWEHPGPAPSPRNPEEHPGPAPSPRSPEDLRPPGGRTGESIDLESWRSAGPDESSRGTEGQGIPDGPPEAAPEAALNPASESTRAASGAVSAAASALEAALEAGSKKRAKKKGKAKKAAPPRLLDGRPSLGAQKGNGKGRGSQAQAWEDPGAMPARSSYFTGPSTNGNCSDRSELPSLRPEPFCKLYSSGGRIESVTTKPFPCRCVAEPRIGVHSMSDYT
jgi:hypothetical protein